MHDMHTAAQCFLQSPCCGLFQPGEAQTSRYDQWRQHLFQAGFLFVTRKWYLIQRAAEDAEHVNWAAYRMMVRWFRSWNVAHQRCDGSQREVILIEARRLPGNIGQAFVMK